MQFEVFTIPSGGGEAMQALNVSAIILGGTFDNATSTGGSFVCFERASAGGFTIPSYVLSSLPTSRAQ